MANYLVRRGYDIKKVSDSEKNNQFKVFLFSDTNELRSAMTRFNQEV